MRCQGMTVGKKLVAALETNVRELKAALATDRNFDILVRELQLGRKKSFCFLWTGWSAI